MRIANISSQYETAMGDPIKAVERVTLSLEHGEVLGIAGESGCGKSSLAAVLSSNIAPNTQITSGTITIDDRPEIDVVKYRGIPRDWRGSVVSLLPQRALNALNPTARIGNYVQDVIKTHRPEISKEEIRSMASKRLIELGLPPGVLNSYPHQLSGGMRQRVVTIVSTLLNPTVLIADEPTSALDVSSQKALVLMIQKMIEVGTISRCIFITHDLALLSNIADRVAIMYAGQVVEVGTTMEIVSNSTHPYTNALLASALEPDKDLRSVTIHGLGGSSPDMRRPPSGCRFHPRCPHAMDICRKQEPKEFGDERRFSKCWLLDPEVVPVETRRELSRREREAYVTPGASTTTSGAERIV